MLYFTSDWHVGHENIIKFCNRPFESLEEMHEVLVTNYNSVVTYKDDVWFLGDLVLRATDAQSKLFGRLKGHKHVVWGNHDRSHRRVLSKYFETNWEYKELKYDKRRFILMHYPIHSWNGRNKGSIHLHGHTHGTLPFDKRLRRMDVGVDVHNFHPVSYEEICKITDTVEVNSNQEA